MIKKRVERSVYCWLITALSVALMCGIFVYVLKQTDNLPAIWILGTFIVFLFLSTLFYMPLSVSLDKDNLNIIRPIRVGYISLSEIRDVRLCPPTVGAKTIFGSGGWFGWYGWFSERDTGRYFAYYGKASDCFIVTLENGQKYMLGCKDAAEMVEAIKERLSH